MYESQPKEGALLGPSLLKLEISRWCARYSSLSVNGGGTIVGLHLINLAAEKGQEQIL